MDERIECPCCGSGAVAVARNMLSTRTCRDCGHSWDPPSNEIATLRARLKAAEAVVDAARLVPELVALTVRMTMDTAMPTAEPFDESIAERVREIQKRVRDALVTYDAATPQTPRSTP